MAHVNWYCKIYEQVQEGLSKGQAASASIHGSLLIVGEMLSHTGDFMVPRFQEVCQAVLSVREHKDRCIRLSVIEILPRLAQFCSDMFARVYLGDCLAHLMTATRHSELRPHAFLALGGCPLHAGGVIRGLGLVGWLAGYFERPTRQWLIHIHTLHRNQGGWPWRSAITCGRSFRRCWCWCAST